MGVKPGENEIRALGGSSRALEGTGGKGVGLDSKNRESHSMLQRGKS